jgi:hypothetical protein
MASVALSTAGAACLMCIAEPAVKRRLAAVQAGKSSDLRPPFWSPDVEIDRLFLTAEEEEVNPEVVGASLMSPAPN